MRRLTAWYAPPLTVAITVVAAWLATGVSPSEALRFIVYQMLVVLGPGMVLHGLLVPGRRSRLERVAVGYALGIAALLGAFALTATTGTRGLLVLVPALIYVIGLVRLRRTGRSLSLRAEIAGLPRSGATAWLAAGVACGTLLSLSLGFAASNPLPRDAASVSYSQDLMFHLSLAAEAKHHWPLQEPSVAGGALHYHTFANIDMAAASQVTGIPVDVVLFRLWPVAILLAVGLLMALVTLRLGASARAAVLAVALTTLAGELDVATKLTSPFLGGSALARIESPSFLLGVVFFLAALHVILEILRREPDGGETSTARSAALLLVLLLAASGAKASVIPIILGGVALVALGDLLVRRRIACDVVVVGGMAVLALAVGWAVLYRGGGDAGFELRPMRYGRLVAPSLAALPSDVVGVAALVAMLMPLAGTLGLLLVKGRHLARAEWLLLAMLATAVAAFLALAQPGFSQQYFLLYGYIAGMPLSAYGAMLAWRSLPEPRSRLIPPLVAAMATVLLGAVVGAAVLGGAASPTAIGVLVVAGVLVALAVVVAALVARRQAVPGSRVRTCTALVIPLLLALTFLDYPVDTGARLWPHWKHGEHAWASSRPGVENGMTGGLRDGLIWVRDHSSPSAVIAVNNFWTFPGVPRYFYYSAIAERRAYLEGWGYSNEGLPEVTGGSLPQWLIDRGSASLGGALGQRTALDALRGDGVRYLVVDKLNSRYVGDQALDALIRPRFQNDAVAVYDLSALR